MPRSCGLRLILLKVLIPVLAAAACGDNDNKKEEEFVRNCHISVRASCTIDVCLNRYMDPPKPADGGPAPDPFVSPSQELIDRCVAAELGRNGNCRPEAATGCHGKTPVYLSSEDCERNGGHPACTDLCSPTPEGGIFCFVTCTSYCIQ